MYIYIYIFYVYILYIYVYIYILYIYVYIYMKPVLIVETACALAFIWGLTRKSRFVANCRLGMSLLFAWVDDAGPGEGFFAGFSSSMCQN